MGGQGREAVEGHGRVGRGVGPGGADLDPVADRPARVALNALTGRQPTEPFTVTGSLASDAALPGQNTLLERALAQNPAEIAAMKARVIANRDTSVLFDQPGLARAMADLFKAMVADYQSGALPAPDLANLDRYHDAGLSFDHEGVEMAGVADYDGLYQAYFEREHRRTPLAPDTRLSPAGGR